MPEDVWKSRCVTVTGDEEESGSKLQMTLSGRQAGVLGDGYSPRTFLPDATSLEP